MCNGIYTHTDVGSNPDDTLIFIIFPFFTSVVAVHAFPLIHLHCNGTNVPDTIIPSVFVVFGFAKAITNPSLGAVYGFCEKRFIIPVPY